MEKLQKVTFERFSFKSIRSINNKVCLFVS